MDFYDEMYDSGYDDPQDYMDSLEDRAIEYMDLHTNSRYEEPEDEEAIGPPYFVDYLASVFVKRFNHLINARFFPRVVSLLDGHKCVVMCVSGYDEETGEVYRAVYWPFYEATEEELGNLPDYVSDFVIRIRMQDRYDPETSESCPASFQPVTWLSYSMSKDEDDFVLSGGKCMINFIWTEEDNQYSRSQNYLLARLNARINKEDKKNSWVDEYGCVYNSDKNKLISCNRELKEYAIRPGTLCICDEAFRYCRDIESVTIPESVVIIGSNAFELCQKLKQITIPNSILKIERSAFYRCEYLEEVFFIDDNSVFHKQVDFSEYLFHTCKKLRRVHLPNYTRSIGSRMFYECKELTSVNIPDGVIKLGSSAFYNCESLETITIPESVEFIDSHCFECCTNLQEIYLPKEAKVYGPFLDGCTSLKRVIIPVGCNIKRYLQYIPNGVTIIEDEK